MKALGSCPHAVLLSTHQQLIFVHSYYTAGTADTQDNQRLHALRGSSANIWDSSWDYAGKALFPFSELPKSGSRNTHWHLVSFSLIREVSVSEQRCLGHRWNNPRCWLEQIYGLF